jgi:hypothetical protein
MNAYSQDLRDKVIEIFKQGNHTRLEISNLVKIGYKTGTPYKETGYDLARMLYGMGYRKLILFSGETATGAIPEYLQVVYKKDILATETLHKI